MFFVCFFILFPKTTTTTKSGEASYVSGLADKFFFWKVLIPVQFFPV